MKQVVIWVNGCFDVLHRGHIELLKYAKSLGDVLIVGIDSDERVSLLKGPSRPVNSLEDRIEMLISIKYVDKVVYFSCESELESQVLISEADIMVVGSDYENKNVVGSRHVKEVKYYRKIDGYSTTKIVEHSLNR